MKKCFLILFCLLLCGCGYSGDNYSEECIVIRDNDHISGIRYIITLEESLNLDNITISPKLYESINHFMDYKSITKLDIYVEIHNKSNFKYNLKEVSFNNKKRYNYDKKITKDKIE
ncbi:MAG: hypothetical protein IJ842_02855, partial [Bacilli bacterium]|nr:hypothetical protein [Bacilli bacterium]